MDIFVENTEEMQERRINVNSLNEVKHFKSKKEMVDSPDHYQSENGLEAIDVIEAFNLNFNLGNVVKYTLRCGKKDDAIQELRKVIWYAEREIKCLEKRK